jgi:Rrf2 family protein
LTIRLSNDMIWTMQISLSRRGDYALRAVLDLARHEGQGLRKARDVAQAMAIPPRYLAQILAGLVREGLLEATAGREGGYVLARSAAQISLLEVIRATEPVGLRGCLLRGMPCGEDGHCALHESWSNAQSALNEVLEATNFADLAQRSVPADR